MTGWGLYWFTRLDGLNNAIGLICLIAGIIFAASGIAWIMCQGILASNVRYGDTDGDVRSMRIWIPIWKTIFLWSLPIFIFFGSINILLPTEKEYAAIYLLPKIVNNEQVQAMPDKALQVLNGKLDEWLKGMQDKEGTSPTKKGGNK